MSLLKQKSTFFLKVLINHYHGDSYDDSLLSCLPEEQAKAVFNMPTDDYNVDTIFQSYEELIANIHYSWLVKPMEKIPKELHSSIIATMPKGHMKGLCHLLQCPTPTQAEPSPPVKRYLLKLLYSHIDGADAVLPIGYLPQLPLSPLLIVNKNLLLEMIDLLGLYDLAEKVRHIVDKKQLEKIYHCISPLKRKFLHVCLNQVNKVQLSEIDLSSWSGDPKMLKQILHSRGLLRLSKAIAGYPNSFLWHFTHRLDTGRGQIINQQYREEEIPNLTQPLAQQVAFVIKTITPKSERE